MSRDLTLILVDPDSSLCAAWEAEFDGLPRVEIVNDFFKGLPTFDCMVAAANSFGLMDGGVDAAIIRFFGPQVMERVQARILGEFLGEQPVGTSFIVETDHPRHPFVAHTPTMRLPMPIARTDHVYLATWAALLAVRRHNHTESRKIEILACPGLGTGTGRVPQTEAARQMALAYRNFLQPPSGLDWQYAIHWQEKIGRGGDIAISFARSERSES